MRWFKRGDEMEANDTEPIRLDDDQAHGYVPDGPRPDPHGQTRIYDEMPAEDRATAERVIADSRAQGWSGQVGEDDTTAVTDPHLEQAERLAEFADRAEAGEFGPTITYPHVPQPSRHVLGESVVARMPVPRAIVSVHREPCPTCQGSGYMPSVSDLLRETASWIEDMDGVVRYFYTTLMEMARTDAERDARETGQSDPLAAGQKAVDDLAFIFPADLISAATKEAGSRGAAQRDKLADALVGMATLYDPADQEKMERLENVIRSMGARHAAFARRDGTIQGATLGEYHLVWRGLAATLATLGDRFTPQHAEAWRIAYDDVAAGMMRAQRDASTAPRFPRA
jgi:hemoglobin-like flavoprotein